MIIYLENKKHYTTSDIKNGRTWVAQYYHGLLFPFSGEMSMVSKPYFSYL